jgi:hypothetical protein
MARDTDSGVRSARSMSDLLKWVILSPMMGGGSYIISKRVLTYTMCGPRAGDNEETGKFPPPHATAVSVLVITGFMRRNQSVGVVPLLPE